MRSLFIFIVLLAVCGYAYSKYGEPLLDRIQQHEASAEEVATEDPKSDPSNEVHDEATWTFRTSEGDAAPRTEVTLTYAGTQHVIGTFDGECFLIEESSWTLLQDETTGIICWWAGGGTEIGVFNRNGVVTVEKGFLDEGSEEYPAFRGDFSVIKAL